VGGIRGEKGSSLLLSYLPAGTMGPIRTVKIVREEIDLKKLQTGDDQK
jgi:C-terminal processing protease CtpA/Prc